MTDARCEPPEGLRERPGYHWLRRADTENRTPPVIWTWRTPEMVWRSQGVERTPGEMHHHYVAPVATPDTVRALVEALEAADQFIRNGIELGFIRMPSAGTPDPALNTPGKVEAALARAKAEGLCPTPSPAAPRT
jgi:hypothetical protein